MAEWGTATWLRFNALICTLVFLTATLVSPALTDGERVLSVVVAPFGGLLLCLLITLTFSIMLFVPGFSIIFGLLRLIYLWTFSRLVVQPAPGVEMPLWTSGKHR